jgi:hypothetical protein
MTEMNVIAGSEFDFQLLIPFTEGAIRSGISPRQRFPFKRIFSFSQLAR